MMKCCTVVVMIVMSLFCLRTPLSAQGNSVDMSPKWNAYIRAWHQTDLTDGASIPSQFLIKEARFGVTGNINEYASYKFLIDAAKLVTISTVADSVPNSTKGKFFLKSATAGGTDYLQDAAVDITPTKSLTFSLGQFKVPFSTDNNRSGCVTDFANRPMTTNVAPSIRDLGFMAGYKTGGSMPIDLYGGLFNGTGADKKENDKTTDFALRGVVKPMKDIGVSLNYYGGKASGADLAMINVGADWKVGDLFIDGEYGMKSLKASASAVTSNAYFMYATYQLSFVDMMVTSIIPAIRYDWYDQNIDVQKNEISRITAGLTVSFAKISFAHFRLNYEKYANTAGVPNSDTIVAEFQTRF